ncbi:hypothetical protein HDN1F_01600 [gamma proteobacterium HdN1]|nr:hypothetical protein HDN1F_01600 [gamma proteobacterium HdN1]
MENAISTVQKAWQALHAAYGQNQARGVKSTNEPTLAQEAPYSLSQALRNSAQTAIRTLRKRQLPKHELESLTSALPASAITPILNAVEYFDLEQAANLIDTLLKKESR